MLGSLPNAGRVILREPGDPPKPGYVFGAVLELGMSQAKLDGLIPARLEGPISVSHLIG